MRVRRKWANGLILWSRLLAEREHNNMYNIMLWEYCALWRIHYYKIYLRMECHIILYALLFGERYYVNP